MREYDETTLKVAERVLKRSEEIVRQRQIKATKIRRISYAVTGLCAAAILCFGIFKLSKYTLGRNSNPHGNYQPTTSDTTIESKTTTASTTTVTETDITTSTSTTLTTTTTVSTSSVTTTLKPVTTTEIEEPSDENETPEEPVVNTEEPEVSPAIPEVPTAPATKAVVQPTKCGDVNGDGSIDIEDAVMITSFLNSGAKNWEEFYKKNKPETSKLSAEQALANADTFKPSDKRVITIDDANAIMGYINGQNQLPTNKLPEDD